MKKLSSQLAVIILSSTAFIIICLFQIFGWHRHYINVYPPDLAALLISRHRPPSECFYLHWFEIMGPQEGEARAWCVHEYAKLAKDPTACELLMPSDYGWDCLGAAEKPNARQCWFDFGPNPPEVGRGKDYVTFPECARNPQFMRENRCCELAQTLYIEKKSTCDSLKEPMNLHDQCLELMAKRDKKLDLCSQIQDENIRGSCEVAVRALQH